MGYPKHGPYWTLLPQKGLEELRMHEDGPIPPLEKAECLVRIEAVSLNYRDVAIPLGKYPMPTSNEVVPCSDGAGTVLAKGDDVSLFKVGDRVCTLFNQGHQKGPLTAAIRKTSLGSHRDGVLRQYAIFNEMHLIAVPANLSVRESSTLPCAALTAWNALTGIGDHSLRANDIVLTQGTGGVSLFAIQFALAKGATVIATTSSSAKADSLRALGVQHVINYKEEREWGETAKKLTPNGGGIHHIIEVGGETTMAQSLKAIRVEGVISIIGFLGGKPGEQLSSFSDVLKTQSLVRGVNVGSKEQFSAMNEFIEHHQIKPIVDKGLFTFREARNAFQYLADAKHFGKVVIDIASEEDVKRS